MVIKTGLILIYVYFVGQNNLLRSAGEQKLFDCVLLINFLYDGIVFFTLLTVLSMIYFHSDDSTKEEKGASSGMLDKHL